MKKLIIGIVIGLIMASCQGNNDSATPAPPQQGLTMFHIHCSDFATYSDNMETPVIRFDVCYSAFPDYNRGTCFDVGLKRDVPLTFLPGDGIWYLWAIEYDSRGNSAPSNMVTDKVEGGVITQL